MLTYEDLMRIFEAKCKKYPPEELDEDMKMLLCDEAIKEVHIMDMINKGNTVI